MLHLNVFSEDVAYCHTGEVNVSSSEICIITNTEKSTRKLWESWYGGDVMMLVKKGLCMHMKMTRWRWYMSFMGSINLVKQTFSSVLQDK